MNTTEPTTLILAGEGYNLAIAPEAEARKLELLATASKIAAVGSNDDSAAAQRVSRSLAAMRIEVEKSRKAIKEPVNRIGKLIDSTAANFIEEISAEEKRITQLVGDHAAEVARLKAEKEAEEKRAFEAAAAAKALAQETGGIAAVLAAKKANAEKLQASTEVATTKVADGVRFAWDFEVEDAASVYRAAPDFVTLEVKRAAVLSWLKELEAADDNVTGKAALVGIRAFKKPIVSSR